MLATQVNAVSPCTGGHCSKQSVIEHVNSICKQNDWPVGHHVLVKGPGGIWCYCTCSCLAAGSLIQATPSAQKKVEEFAIGDSVMTCDLNFNWKEAKVADLAGTDQIGQPNTVFVAYEGGSLTITADHLFLVGNKHLLPADKLTIADTLTATDGTPVKINTVHQGDFFGSFHNLSTDSSTDPSKDPNHHLLNTAGVISGDYALQTSYLVGALNENLMLHPETQSRPSVGSVDYHNKFPFSEPTPEAVAAAKKAGIVFGNEKSKKAGTLIIRREHDGDYENIEAKNVLGFVPLHKIGILEELPRYAFSDAQRNALGEYLCKLFKAFYPEIEFKIDWYLRNVNVFAIPEVNKQKSLVLISGGFLRIKSLDVGSISLAISYAVTNILAEKEQKQNVGFSDYNGAAIVMRQIWWEEDYITRMEAAVKELEELFRFIPNNFGLKFNPVYPSGLCRLSTYDNAMTVTGIPPCAKEEN